MPARKILVCAAGLSPQIVTETVYALALGTPAWLPDEIHLITTAEGARRAKLTPPRHRSPRCIRPPR